jgi:hypothetical protein
MRFVVLLFGLLGVALTAFAGLMFILFEVVITVLKDNGVGDELIDFLSASPVGTSHGDTGLFLILAAGYGFLGTILGFMRCGWQGALLMLVPVICTSLMNWYTAVFTGVLALAGLLSFLIFPVPMAAPQVKEED